jgi:GGDEF domain-containing protein
VAQVLGAGADELLAWPEGQAELVPRIQAILRRRREDLGRQPLTGLPGGAALWAAVEEAQNRGQAVAVLAFDLRHFKAFNDRYGFVRADCVLSFVANLLEVVAKDAANVYHIGGDDFCLVCAPEAAESLARKAIESFAEGVASYYDEVDRQAGGFLAPARDDGVLRWYPLMSLTVASVVVEAGSGAEEISRLLARLRVEAKQNGHQQERGDGKTQGVLSGKEEAPRFGDDGSGHPTSGQV